MAHGDGDARQRYLPTREGFLRFVGGHLLDLWSTAQEIVTDPACPEWAGDHTDVEELLRGTLHRLARHWSTWALQDPTGYAYHCLLREAALLRRRRGDDAFDVALCVAADAVVEASPVDFEPPPEPTVLALDAWETARRSPWRRRVTVPARCLIS